MLAYSVMEVKRVDDRFGVIVGGVLYLGLCFCQRLRGDGAVGGEQFLEDLGDCAFEEASFVVNQVGEAVGIDGSVDLLNDEALEVVACVM